MEMHSRRFFKCSYLFFVNHIDEMFVAKTAAGCSFRNPVDVIVYSSLHSCRGGVGGWWGWGGG